jgi:hypothetical protein
MRLRSLVPPVGWMVAIASALAASLWATSASDTGDFLSQWSEPTEEELAATASPAGTFALAPSTNPDSAGALLGRRPLLAEGRRPHSASPPPAAELAPEPTEVPQDVAALPPPVPPVLSMLGSLEKDNNRSVLLRDEASGSEAWYRVGDVILDWTIVEILPDSVRLQLQDAEIAFNLFQE